MSALRGTVVAMVFVAGLGAYSAIGRTSNYKPAKASVFMIDRKCNFIETTTEPNGRKTARGVTDDCKSSEEWGKVREERKKDVSGTAVVHVEYVAPQDGRSHTSQLKFNGREDEFYDIKAGDQINVLVRNDNPDQVIKA